MHLSVSRLGDLSIPGGAPFGQGANPNAPPIQKYSSVTAFGGGSAVAPALFSTVTPIKAAPSATAPKSNNLSVPGSAPVLGGPGGCGPEPARGGPGIVKPYLDAAAGKVWNDCILRAYAARPDCSTVDCLSTPPPSSAPAPAAPAPSSSSSAPVALPPSSSPASSTLVAPISVPASGGGGAPDPGAPAAAAPVSAAAAAGGAAPVQAPAPAAAAASSGPSTGLIVGVGVAALALGTWLYLR